ncbi:hypothetical protein ACPOL_1849 [Acidisarcina polymorpha]|uniref:Uncharacterized protein n=1 Tax=Acidisarcina polymorpha TaxID=2211140 RepID=A0A2Z5FWD6_9BACT|nr:hypothetical protein ACPOL_1849 [Acidisarcina polymorpha]
MRGHFHHRYIFEALKTPKVVLAGSVGVLLRESRVKRFGAL